MTREGADGAMATRNITFGDVRMILKTSFPCIPGTRCDRLQWPTRR